MECSLTRKAESHNDTPILTDRELEQCGEFYRHHATRFHHAGVPFIVFAATPRLWIEELFLPGTV